MKPLNHWLVLLLFIVLLPLSVQAQQRMPRLLHQFSERPGLNLKAGHMSQDVQGRLWIASNDGVASYDGHQFRVYHDPVVKKGDYYYIVFPTPDGRVWAKMGRGYSMAYVDSSRQRMIRLPDTTRLVRDYLARYGCHYVVADAAGMLWIGLKKKGLLRFNPRTLAVDHVVDRPLDVRGITPDNRGTIYFTTIEQGLFAYTPQTGQLRNYRHNDQDTTSLSSNAAYGVSVRHDGRILIGLVNEVNLLTPATGKIQRLRLNAVHSVNPLLEDYIYDFQHDLQGNTYFTTGVSTFRYTRRGVVQRLVFASPTDFIEGLYVSPANRLWISAAHRLYEYDLNQIRVVPSLILLRLLVNGTQLEGNTATRRLVYDTLGHSTLTVQENDLFSLRFALLASRRSLTIRHQLQGYDREWMVHENLEGTASYQLPAGTYAFAVNRGHPAGGWDPTVATLTVVVEPPFWKTRYALAITLLLIGGVGYFMIRTYHRRQQLRQQLLLEQNEAAVQRGLNEFKTNFFANVTHEFRTPLTIILNATEQLANTSLSQPQQDRLESIQRNSHQLLRLINETLDIAKLDAGKLDQHSRVGDPVAFVGQIIAQFEGLAGQKGIGLHWIPGAGTQATGSSGSMPGTLYSFDDNKLEKIVYNLLANALKFTPANGKVRVEVHIADADALVLRVTDTGIGIQADQLSRIFERFHQVDARATRAYSGTGIGLALVKELTEWLGGSVTVESEPGRGSVFTVAIPVTPQTAVNHHHPPLAGPVNTTEFSMRQQPIEFDENGCDSDLAGRPESGNTDTKPLVLIVEDNAEMRTYVAEFLSPYYQVLTATNGQQGLERAVAEVPDLIVSDVMMPELDGYELTERLKADDRTSHIPLVLLTARSSYDSKMKGLGAGADDYLGKPFSLAELNLRIRNCLQTRQNWQQRLTTQPPDAPTPETAPNPRLDREERFLARLRQLILDNMETETVDVDWLAAQATMSRTQLYRKLTALTTLSPNRFIQQVRLEKAAELLQIGEMNIAQVAYQVGYSSQSYFTKVFQEYFGYAPSKLKV